MLHSLAKDTAGWTPECKQLEKHQSQNVQGHMGFHIKSAAKLKN